VKKFVFITTAPQSQLEATSCSSEIAKGAAIAVGATIAIECLIGAPIIIACTLLLYRKKR
jgi:nitrate reductase gamma subunit